MLAVPFAGIVSLLWSTLGRLAPPSLMHVWSAFPRSAFVACFVVVDAVAYLYHWVGHHTRVGWASHRVHHLGETFDMTLVLRQPWLPVHGLVIIPLTALFGFSFEMAAACSAISIAYQALQHTSRSWSVGRWDALLVSGRAHRRHHVVDSGAVNLGMVFSVWDRALGTWRADAVDEDAAYGVGALEPMSALALQLEGWRRAAAATALSSQRVGEALDVADRGGEHVGQGSGEDEVAGVARAVHGAADHWHAGIEQLAGVGETLVAQRVELVHRDDVGRQAGESSAPACSGHASGSEA